MELRNYLIMCIKQSLIIIGVMSSVGLCGQNAFADKLQKTKATSVESQERVNAQSNKTDDEGFDDEGFDDGGFDDGGFDDLGDIALSPSKIPPPPSPLRIDGFLRSQWAQWSLRPLKDSWAKGRQSLDLSAKYKKEDWTLTADGHVEYDLLYDLADGPFDPIQEEEYRLRYIPGVQSMMKRFSLGQVGITLSTGKQIVTWGESDGLSALDVINPQDQREPGVADIDDMKLSVWLSRLQIAQGKHSAEFIVRHEGNYGILVPPKADYSPFNAMIQQQADRIPPPLVELLQSKSFRFAHEKEGIARDTQSYFLRYLFRGEGMDIGLYGASLLDQQGVIGSINQAQLLSPAQKQVDITYQHPRYTLTGLTIAKPIGSFLWKGELVSSLNRPVNVGEEGDINQLEVVAVDTLTSVIGLSYSGFTDTMLSIDYQKGFLVGEEPDKPFFVPPTLDILALRATRTFWRERFSTGVVASFIVPQWSTPSKWLQPKRGGLIRADLSYRLLDQLKASLGYVHYLTGEAFGPFYGLDEHDRLFMSLRWDFTVY